MENKIKEWEFYIKELKSELDFFKTNYFKINSDIESKLMRIRELENENINLKQTINAMNSLHSEGSIDLDYLISIEKSYGELICENASLIQFKEIAVENVLTKKQLSEIYDIIENIPDTNY